MSEWHYGQDPSEARFEGFVLGCATGIAFCIVVGLLTWMVVAFA